MTEAALGADDNVGSSQQADIDAAYDDDTSGDALDDPAGGSADPLAGEQDAATSHEADVEAGFDDQD